MYLLASSNPLDHVYQWIYLKTEVGGFDFTLLSNHIVMQIIAAILLVFLFPMLVRMRQTGDPVSDLTPRGFGNFIDSICNYLRTEIAQPMLGDYTDRFIPYIWSAFFYILTVNLLGLIPLEAITRGAVQGVFPEAHHGIGGAATGNIFVTGALATVTMVMMVFNGLRLGGMHYIAHFCPGPLWLAPILIPVELVGLVAKIFALTVRLFANMVAGHVLLAVLASFIALTYHALGTGGASGVAFVVTIVSVLFNLLEIFVAFLQAFIFAFLSAVFIGQSIVFHHDDHDEAAAH